jgi:hypothetical protein
VARLVWEYHLAASVAGIELAKRSHSSNKETEIDGFLERLIPILEEEQSLIKKLIASLDASESTAKKLAAWTAEKIGRLKLNDSILSYSDLSRVIELETLLVGLQGQSRMWRVLEAYCSDHPGFIDVDFSLAAQKAEAMLEEIKKHHLQAAKISFCRR